MHLVFLCCFNFDLFSFAIVVLRFVVVGVVAGMCVFVCSFDCFNYGFCHFRWHYPIAGAVVFLVIVFVAGVRSLFVFRLQLSGK